MKYLLNVTSLEFYSEKCTGCGRCVDVCPHGVFVVKDKKAAIVDKDLCMECGACALNCEFGAIKVNAGVGCAAAIINSIITGGPPSCDCGGSPSQSASSSCCYLKMPIGIFKIRKPPSGKKIWSDIKYHPIGEKKQEGG